MGEELGEGNAAVVYQGIMREEGEEEGREGEEEGGERGERGERGRERREVAVKVVKKKSFESLFKEEEVMRGLDHPNLVKMFGVCFIGVSDLYLYSILYICLNKLR